MVASGRLYTLLLLGVVPFLALFFEPNLKIAGLVYDLALLAVFVADLYLTPAPRFLNASRACAERLSIGRGNAVEIAVVNGSLRALSCRVKDEYPLGLAASPNQFTFSLPGSSQALLRYELTPRQRGLYWFGAIHIRYLSRLGLFWRIRKIDQSQPVKVFSDLKALHDLTVKLYRLAQLGELSPGKRGQGTNFASLREYAVGDDPRSIDWKATARTDRPVVRSYEAEQEQVLLILLDAGRMMVSDLEGLSRFDHALNAGLCLAAAGVSRNDQVGLGIFADRPLLYLPPRRGKNQLKRILESVFDSAPQMVEPDYMGVLSYFASVQKTRSLMVVITDLTDAYGSQALLSGLYALAPRHLPFCVTLRDKQLDQIARQKVQGAFQVYCRAVAVDLVQQRELALSGLIRRGCLVLDAAPQDISNHLVDRYLEIKARARL